MSWLRTFVPYEGETDALAERLSLTGLAVEAIHRPGADIAGVIVAEVRHVERHPDADKLHLVKAFDGSRTRDIVCGASNYAVGDRVPLATPGARLPGGFEIASREVRGAVSDGMLCSAKELGLGADHTGILVLDEDEKPGSDLVEQLELDDEVLEIDVLPNRPDALSVLGVARDVAAIFGLGLYVPELTLSETDEDAGDVIGVEVADADGCPRYTARVLRNARSGGLSPWWLRRRLILAGMRPIDPIVDATNHQMLEIGQPLHAFDLATIRGGRIRVRAAHEGETIETLDGVTRTLEEGDVLICDADRPIALGGVMGGAETEVGPETEAILLESATFSANRIARTSRRLDLRSEAAQRYERGVDSAIAEVANGRCAALIAALTGATVSRGAVAGGPGAPQPPRILVTVPKIVALTGAPITKEIAETTLRAIGADVEAANDSLAVTPPTWRPDMRLPEDVVEEIARLYGYERIPETLPTGGRTGGLTPAQRARRAIRAAARAAGCDESVTLSLIAPGLPDRLGLPVEHPWRRTVAVANPLSEEESRLRPSLVPGLLEVARRNATRRVMPIRIFELGNVFTPQGVDVLESLRCTAVLAGDAPEGWHAQSRAMDVFDARAVLDAVTAVLGVDVVVEQDDDPPAPFHPGRTGRVLLDGHAVGLLGELHPRAAEAFELSGRVAILDLEIGPLLAREKRAVAPELSRLPALDRDLALLVDAGTASSAVLTAVRGGGGDLLESVEIFDRYEGPQVPEGKVSLALAIRLRAPDRTLTDEEAAGVMSAITAEAERRGWTVR